jgi:hypothetical protein
MTPLLSEGEFTTPCYPLKSRKVLSTWHKVEWPVKPLRLPRGARQAGQNFTPGLTSRVSLHVGHLTFVSLILFSSAIGVNPSGDFIRRVDRMVSPPRASFPKRGRRVPPWEVGDFPDAGRAEGGNTRFILANFKIAAEYSMSHGKGSQTARKECHAPEAHFPTRAGQEHRYGDERRS